jgi:hypothetical protein
MNRRAALEFMTGLSRLSTGARRGKRSTGRGPTIASVPAQRQEISVQFASRKWG